MENVPAGSTRAIKNIVVHPIRKEAELLFEMAPHQKLIEIFTFFI